MDLRAGIRQSAADKLVASVGYPFVLFEHNEPFSPFLEMDQVPEADYRFSDEELRQLLADADGSAVTTAELSSTRSPADEIHAGVLLAAGETIESAKAALTALENDTEGEYEGPSRDELETIVQGGVVGLAAIGGVEARFHCPWARVQLRSAPSIGLNAPRIDVQADVSGGATGEAWLYHPVLRCRGWCLRWSIVWKWSRLASITLGDVHFDAAFHADLSTDRTRILVTGVADRLRLDYDILRKIPLEKIANRYLSRRAVVVFDAGDFVATLPVLKSRFRPEAVRIPAASGAIEIEVDVAQV